MAVGVSSLFASITYLQVKELAVSSVDDMGSGVRVSDVDEVHLVRERRAQTKGGPLGAKSLSQRHHGTTSACPNDTKHIPS